MCQVPGANVNAFTCVTIFSHSHDIGVQVSDVAHKGVMLKYWQIPSLCIHLFIKCTWIEAAVSYSSLCDAFITQNGAPKVLADERSSVKHVFLIWDCLPAGDLTQKVQQFWKTLRFLICCLLTWDDVANITFCLGRVHPNRWLIAQPARGSAFHLETLKLVLKLEHACSEAKLRGAENTQQHSQEETILIIKRGVLDLSQNFISEHVKTRYIFIKRDTIHQHVAKWFWNLDTQQTRLEIFKISDARVNKSEFFGLKKIN